MSRPKKEPEDDLDLSLHSKEHQRVLDDLGLMTETDLCLLYGCGRKAMQNRPRAEMPAFFKAGGKRMFFKADVVKFFRSRVLE